MTKDFEEGDVVLRRRDEPDLRLSRADRDAERAAALLPLHVGPLNYIGHVTRRAASTVVR